MEENNRQKDLTINEWYITDAPKTLGEIFGQPLITKYYKEKQRTQEWDKSTFFTGSFGSGKTALAKILAKSIACKKTNEKGEPCDECLTCNAINRETYDRDVIYLNGTSMSAQEVDLVLDRVSLTPAIRDRARVLIADETQDFSPAAISRFLTFTQSPQRGIYYIFTAMEKLKGRGSGALFSRCKVWKMKSPAVADVYKYLAGVCMSKNLSEGGNVFLTEGLRFIAENCEGSFRKAIQMLQQCHEGGIFTVGEMKDIFGVISYEDAANVLVDIAHGKPTENLFKNLTGEDYQERFTLLLKVLGDAATYRTFGSKFIEEEDKWKWQIPMNIASGKNFDMMCDMFCDLSKNAYIKRGDYMIAISNLLHKGASATIGNSVAPPSEIPKPDATEPCAPVQIQKRRTVKNQVS